MFYKINKGHIFPNGNKRMSIACLLIFLLLNKKELKQTDDELTRNAVFELAESDAAAFDAVKRELEVWIRTNI